MSSLRAFSAPGKALLAGGYLVLDPQYRSYVVALSSRMHCVVDKQSDNGQDWFTVTIRSAQFDNDEWKYTICKHSSYEIVEVNGKVNPFAKKAVEVLVNYCQPDPRETEELLLEVFSDPGYHSVGESTLKKNGHKQFRFHSSTITKVPKTGLGSSAGLVTVLTTSLLSVFQPELDVTSPRYQRIIHNLSQIAHCQAQGKVGSGFDVAAAVFGSIIYQRFDPKLIEDLPAENPSLYSAALVDLVDSTDWNFTHENVTLPPGIRVIMGDVSSGSETTKLVAKVKAWYQQNYPKSLDVYENINRGNLAFINGIEKLTLLSSNSPASYQETLDKLDVGADLSESAEIDQLRKAVIQIRGNLQLITGESGADIEPSVQTELLDCCVELNGVITGVVPGAGGYDAIALIITEKADISGQTSGKKDFSAVTWLDLHQENTGIAEESPSHYRNLQ
ncbi:LAME_0C04610g1_1 [Lachancea meyersii CBS 8951]|uniref:Phosphomevalonate kinase n=1 Tax=Lachancea meyersii CBS 8951 TaxID=1266667 RepID=A0A1G4J102_9SACH|nr:LAME_0C04610g1_1 [Lachancea meyersii CBS 8951]